MLQFVSVQIQRNLAASRMGKCKGCPGSRLLHLPACSGRKFNILRQPVGGREFRNLDQDAEGMAGMDENLLPDAAGILVVAAEGNRSDKIRLEPITSFCDRTDNISFAVYRTDLNTNSIDSILSEYFRAGVSFDNDFDLKTSNKMYCTELVYKVLTIANQNEKFINLSHGNGIDYVACDNLYLNPKTKLIFSHTN